MLWPLWEKFLCSRFRFKEGAQKSLHTCRRRKETDEEQRQVPNLKFSSKKSRVCWQWTNFKQLQFERGQASCLGAQKRGKGTQCTLFAARWRLSIKHPWKQLSNAFWEGIECSSNTMKRADEQCEERQGRRETRGREIQIESGRVALWWQKFENTITAEAANEWGRERERERGSSLPSVSCYWTMLQAVLCACVCVWLGVSAACRRLL